VDALAFYPDGKYASVSITGSSCKLQCKYCRGRYLRCMTSVRNPRELYSLAAKLERKGVRGILISGGFDECGRLPFDSFLPVVREIKRRLGFVLSVHPGLVSRRDAASLKEAGFDVVDYELVLDPVVVSELKNLHGVRPRDFLRSLECLLEEGPPHVAVHIPLGLKYGEIDREFEAVASASELGPDLLVLLVFVPTRGTPMESVPPPPLERVVEVFEFARKKFGGEIALGCMRPPEYKLSLDPLLVEEGLVDRVAIPKLSLVREKELGVFYSCCSLPRSLLSLFTSL